MKLITEGAKTYLTFTDGFMQYSAEIHHDSDTDCYAVKLDAIGLEDEVFDNRMYGIRDTTYIHNLLCMMVGNKIAARAKLYMAIAKDFGITV